MGWYCLDPFVFVNLKSGYVEQEISMNDNAKTQAQPSLAL